MEKAKLYLLLAFLICTYYSDIVKIDHQLVCFQFFPYLRQTL